jgi:hypothetical protein
VLGFASLYPSDELGLFYPTETIENDPKTLVKQLGRVCVAMSEGPT